MFEAVDHTASTAALLASDGAVVVLQSGDRPFLTAPPEFQAALNLFATLLIGGLLLGGARLYVDDMARRIRSDAVPCAALGIVFLIGTAAVMVVVVPLLPGGISLLTLPAWLIVIVISIAGKAMALIAVLERPLDSAGAALLVGAGIDAGLVFVATIGPFVSVLVGSLGVGAMLHDWRTS